MRIIIIEDEIPAVEKLQRFILKYDPSFEILKVLTSVVESVSWLQENKQAFDLAFMDIQLTDGSSFDIFSQIDIEKPIIFTTAFDEFALEAFKVNSLHYLLKPLTFQDFSEALNKLNKIKSVLFNSQTNQNFSKSLETVKLKNRFMVKLGNHIHSVKTVDIAYFFAEGRTVFIVTNQDKKFIIDYTLEDLTGIIDLNDFYRVNRTFIVNINAIEKVLVYSNNRLKICTFQQSEKEIIVSREKVSKFKLWFEGD